MLLIIAASFIEMYKDKNQSLNDQYLFVLLTLFLLPITQADRRELFSQGLFQTENSRFK